MKLRYETGLMNNNCWINWKPILDGGEIWPVMTPQICTLKMVVMMSYRLEDGLIFEFLTKLILWTDISHLKVILQDKKKNCWDNGIDTFLLCNIATHTNGHI